MSETDKYDWIFEPTNHFRWRRTRVTLLGQSMRELVLEQLFVVRKAGPSGMRFTLGTREQWCEVPIVEDE